MGMLFILYLIRVSALFSVAFQGNGWTSKSPRIKCKVTFCIKFKNIHTYHTHSKSSDQNRLPKLSLRWTGIFNFVFLCIQMHLSKDKSFWLPNGKYYLPSPYSDAWVSSEIFVATNTSSMQHYVFTLYLSYMHSSRKRFKWQQFQRWTRPEFIMKGWIVMNCRAF